MPEKPHDSSIPDEPQDWADSVPLFSQEDIAALTDDAARGPSDAEANEGAMDAMLPPTEPSADDASGIDFGLDEVLGVAGQDQSVDSDLDREQVVPDFGDAATAEVEAEYAAAGDTKEVIQPVSSEPPDGLKRQLAKIAVSLLFGVACGIAAFSWLVLNLGRLSDGLIRGSGESIIERAVTSAEGLVDDILYDRADMELEDALAAAPRAANWAEADYRKIKSEYLRLPNEPDTQAAASLLTNMGAFAERSPNHPRVTEVLRWRGEVFCRVGDPLAALGVYNDLLSNYASPIDGDRILLAAGRVALELDRPQQAADYLHRLRQEYPASPVADEAGLYHGDAYAKLGANDKANLIYQQIAVSNPAERVGSRAYARLAQLSYDEGEYDEAIELLETRLSTATATDGDEDAYLLLARALRATGQHEEAERVLREFTHFFPENARTAEALVELSKVMDARGHRREAANIARQAARRYPGSTAALENEALFLAQAGDERGAAESLLEAEAAGANNPQLLLNAARHYVETGEIKKAQLTYEQLLEEYGGSPEAFDGRIELAGIYFDQGKVQKAIDWLEDLAQIHANSPRAVPILLALGQHYSELGLRDRAAAAQRKVAAVAGEQPVLAEAAIALLEAGDTESGLNAAQQVDVERLANDLAYRFLRAHGLALRKIDGRRALAQLERAYDNYPNQRKPDHAIPLLELYLAADRTGAARALVTDLDALAKADIAAAPALTRAAVTWADHLFERRDFRAAAEAYNIAESAVTEEDKPLMAWVKLQRANALRYMRDASSSTPLLSEVSGSRTMWSADAELREAYADIERRLAHEEPRGRNGD